MRWRRWLLAGGALLVVTAGCGGSSTSKSEGATPANTGATVDIKNIAFNLSHVTVKSGQAVVWVFDDDSTPHNVTGDGFRSANRTSGTFSHTFDRAGKYDYQCSIHAGMNGQVVVTQ
jgi:plastocyanin